MGFLTSLFRRDQKEVDDVFSQRVTALVAGDAQRPAPLQQEIAQMGIKREMIHDDFLEGSAELDALRLSGVDDQGKATNGGRPMIEGDMDSMIMRIMVSPILKTSIQDPAEIEIQKLEAQRNVLRVLLNMDKKDYNLSAITACRAWGMLIEANLESAKNGKMARLLNSTHEERTYSVTNQELKAQKRGFFG